MKIFSNEAKCHVSWSSPSSISSSRLSKCRVRSALIFRISVTPMKTGLSSNTTQLLGAKLTSQSVNAYRASNILSGDTLFARWTTTSTLSAVLSSTFLILILPLSLAFKMLSMSDPVVTP